MPSFKLPQTIKHRLFWLLVCALTGFGIGWIGHYLTGKESWFLALPVTIAVGWLFFANPGECISSRSCRNENDQNSI